jgi:hypothetical protein
MTAPYTTWAHYLRTHTHRRAVEVVDAGLDARRVSTSRMAEAVRPADECPYSLVGG